MPAALIKYISAMATPMAKLSNSIGAEIKCLRMNELYDDERKYPIWYLMLFAFAYEGEMVSIKW